jgi:hypothetical protein
VKTSANRRGGQPEWHKMTPKQRCVVLFKKIDLNTRGLAKITSAVLYLDGRARHQRRAGCARFDGRDARYCARKARAARSERSRIESLAHGGVKLGKQPRLSDGALEATAVFDSEFPRPCKNCGNPVPKVNGEILHVRRNAKRCNTFRQFAIERDSKGLPARMVWLGDVPIPDPPTKEEMEAEKLKEWQRMYGNGSQPAKF